MGAIDEERVGLLSGVELRSAGSDALPLSSGRQGLHGVQQWLRRLLWDGSGWASQELFGLWLYIWSTVFSTAMSIAAKIAGQHGIPVFQTVLTRSAFLLAFTAPALAAARTNPFGGPHPRLLLLRGALGFCSVSSLYLAVSLLPMAEALVLSFLAPVFVAAISPLALREPPPRSVLLALPCCLVGVLLVARPAALFGGSSGSSAAGNLSTIGVAVGLVQAFFSAAAKMCVRALSSSREPMACVIFSMGAVSAVSSAAACALLRSIVLPASRVAWTALALNGIFGYANQVTLTAALQRTQAAPAIAMSYFSVVWGILADLLVFHTPLSALSLLGAGVICASSAGVAWAERRAKARARAQAASAVAAAAATAGGAEPEPQGKASESGADGIASMEVALQAWGKREHAGGKSAVHLPKPAGQEQGGLPPAASEAGASGGAGPPAAEAAAVAAGGEPGSEQGGDLLARRSSSLEAMAQGRHNRLQ